MELKRGKVAGGEDALSRQQPRGLRGKRTNGTERSGEKGDYGMEMGYQGGVVVVEVEMVKAEVRSW